jgi:WD40 repeat protein
MIVKLQKKVKAHGSENTDDLGEIYRIIRWQGKIASLALDSMIKIWDDGLNLISSHSLVEYYMFSLAAEGDRLYVGNGNGEIKVFDENFKHIQTVNICGDIVSDIQIYGNTLVAVSYDGTLALVDLGSF